MEIAKGSDARWSDGGWGAGTGGLHRVRSGCAIRSGADADPGYGYCDCGSAHADTVAHAHTHPNASPTNGDSGASDPDAGCSHRDR